MFSKIKTCLVIAAAATVIGCGEGRAKDVGPAASRNFTVAAFDKIEVAGPYKVSVATGRSPGVEARGGQNLLDQMVVEVEGSTLKIHPRKRDLSIGQWWNGSSNGQTVTVAVSSPMLTSAAIAGSGNVVIDRIATDRFEGAVAGSGGLTLADVQVRKLTLGIAGSGGISGTGKATTARYEIAGSGGIRASKLATEKAVIATAGSGDVQASASATAKVAIAGSGNVRVEGGAKCEIDKVGSGTVNCS